MSLEGLVHYVSDGRIRVGAANDSAAGSVNAGRQGRIYCSERCVRDHLAPTWRQFVQMRMLTAAIYHAIGERLRWLMIGFTFS